MSYLTLADSKQPSFVDRIKFEQGFRQKVLMVIIGTLAVAALASATVFSFKLYMQDGFWARKTLCRLFIAGGMVGGSSLTAVGALFTTAAIVKVCQYDTSAPLKSAQPDNDRPMMLLFKGRA